MSSICDRVALVLPHTKKEQKRQNNILFCKRFDVCESIAQNGYIPKKRQEDFLENIPIEEENANARKKNSSQ